ncbi:hypothetical protein Ddc_10838 [Ditylenchus destructor]|nr:hypothetical protein Ddc_10838 [Ditylenchus destructor]
MSIYKPYKHALFMVSRANSQQYDSIGKVSPVDYEEAAKVDAQLSFPAYYQLAKMHLTKDAPSKVDSKAGFDQWINRVKGGIERLKFAKGVVQKNVLPSLIYFKDKMTENPQTPLQEQLQDRKAVFDKLIHNIDENLKILEECVKRNEELKAQSKLPDVLSEEERKKDKRNYSSRTEKIWKLESKYVYSSDTYGDRYNSMRPE